MKEQLRQIYADLSNGRVSQREALEKIKAIKLQEQGSAASVLAPVWLDAETAPSARDSVYAERHVVLCDIETSVERVGALLPLSECSLLRTDPQATIDARFDEVALACFEQIQAIFRDKPQGKVLLQAVVGGAPEQALLAGLAGMLKTASLENPQFAGQLIVVPAETTVEELVTRLEGERARAKDTLVRYQDGVRQVLRWEVVHAEAAAPAPAFVDGGVYLITGGLGGLAVLFAREIQARTREAKVVLAGRSALGAEKQTVLDQWRFGGRVSYRQADVCDFAQVRQLVTGILQEHGRLDGVLHCAGVLADEFILKKETPQFSAVLAPKVDGTVNLDEATRDVALDFFALFSSVAGVLGNVAQADYAAANGFMDRFAAYRNRLVAAGERHGRTRSINWPLWQEGGMGSDAESRELLLRATGIPAMQTATGLQAFHRCLALPYDQVLVVEGDASPILRALAGGQAAAEQPRAAQPALDAKALAARTEDYVCQELSGILRIPAQNIDPQAALEKYGIDSILAMKLTGQLEKSFGPLSKTLFFEYQTLRDLAQYFVEAHAPRLEELFSAAGSAEAQPVRAAAPAAQARRAVARPASRPPAAASLPVADADPIAIIGLSGRYPEAPDLDAYWNNLRDGKDCIIEVPADRWDWKTYFSDDRTQAGHHYSKWGGFIAGVDEFDPLFFNISPKEAKLIDPQERLFLQHAWMALEDAGYTRAALQLAQAGDLPGQVGVYAGVMYTEYQLFGADASARGQRMGIAGSAASIANRVSYAFNLHGPSVTLDTMCSSSLTAIHFACQDLKSGRTTLAIAGGVNVSIHPNKYLVLSAGQFISGDGHCQSFGEGGDGYIPGEGVGVVVLKRLSDAERDGDQIHGVIRGSALNHGGKTNGYSVPNPQAQASAISRALAESKTDARHVSYIEAHGTGTKLGDPIEIAALSKAFRPYTEEAGFCLIGSAKSNIGHCESAAGIAGLTKVLLQMRYRQIVPSLHSAQLNPHIDFDKTPFIVNQTLRPWEPPVVDGRTLPRIAGISSFGAGGSNAHVIIEEYRPAARKPLALPAVAIVLSARTPEQLRQKAADLLAFVRPRLDTIDLASVAHTLQVGREAMDERLGLVAASAQQLAGRLEAYCAGRAVEELFQGQVLRNRETPDADLQQIIDRSIDGNRLAELLELWVQGVEIDWRRLYGEDTPRRVSLPAYPFARERYWIEIQAPSPVGTVLHPLLHRNVSDLSEQRYSSTFTGSEPFLVERAGRKALAAAAYLEMARAAVEQALPERAPSGIVELREVVWTQPVESRASRQINVALFPAGDDIEFEIYSREEDDEIVHCSGRAAVIEAVDHPSIRRESAQLLGRLRLPEGAEKDAAAYVLHPALVESAFHAAAASRGLSSEQVPVALDSLRVLSPCTNGLDVWARGTGTLDIDLCDEEGRVCAQLRGVRWQAAAAVREAPAVAARAAREIALAPQPVAPSGTARKKRAPISLDAPGPEPAGRTPSAARPSITLSATTANSPAAPVSSAVRLYDRGEGVFAIEAAAGASIADLRNALQRAREEASIKVLTISGAGHCFTRGGRDAVNDAIEQKLWEVVAALPAPVIAAVPGDAIGAGFLLAALCDFMVWSDEARYGWDLAPTAAEEALFAERFGEARAHDLLALSKVSTGAQWRAKGWAGPIVPAAQVEAFAQKLASSLAAKPQDALHLLKQHLTRRLAEAAGALTRDEAAAAPSSSVEALAGSIASLPQHLGLEVAADGVLIVTAPAGAKDLEHLLNAVRGQARAVILAGDAFSGDIDQTAVAGLRRVIAESSIPVVAALQHGAKGNAWLVAQFCDAAVYAEQSLSSAAQIDDGAAFAAFARRFGAAPAREILLTGADYSGAELRQRAGTVLAVDRALVLSTAAGLASSARKQRTSGVVPELPLALSDSGGREEALVPGPIALRSSVVTATAHPGGIVVVAMEDRQAKNMLSQAVTEGMREAFDHIAQTPGYKVVVLTGYDQYFCSGGTKDNLLAIQAGKARFTDSKAFQLPLDCELPVIAAVQGHGIGAGWSLGMFADLALLSEESSYTSPYMGYGFTPGAGATLSLADKIGTELARESLLTAEPQTGRALNERGLLLPVLPRAQMAAAAMSLAGRIARAPRERLAALKRQGAAHLREQLDETYRLELAMHEKTFVGRSDTLARIESTFHQEAAAPVVPAPQAQAVADADLLPAVTSTLRALLANELQMRESDINEHTQFVDVGLDSISGVSWIRKVNEKYQTSIEATKVYSYPTLAQLSVFVKGEAEARGTLGLPAPPAALPPAPPVAPAAHAVETRTPRRRRQSARFAAADGVRRAPQSIAVIGMAGQFPQARNLQEFWRNISEGRNCISRVTRERWDVDAYYQPGAAVAGKSYSDWLGALDEYDRFDPRFFNISPTEAEFMDPQQRLFLQACWHGIEHAGYDARTLSGSKCGVFVGCASGDYHQLSRQHRLSAHGFTGAAMSILASRISYFLNLQGPCVSVDTACSSSLVALAQACDSLNAGDCDLAMAGGVYVMAGPEMHIRTSQAAMLSPEGRCFTFDQRADGFVPGEGVGVVVLKRLADAERDGDLIYGVVEGWGVNQDGKTNGIT
ncbi:MAG TPA: SDR family NAD(P)-dependent oxidoreductase, partial [Thermoanaerobaculia bacterium]|nr:SDR family NAD(P)-dependent oxidoreductase [Thermoanaerobaculia bacterium]